jgi:uncharacterized protein YebE (UPF0316 family)
MVRDLLLTIAMSPTKEARYVAAISSMLMIIVLVVGTLAYTAIRHLTSPIVKVAAAPIVERTPPSST